MRGDADDAGFITIARVMKVQGRKGELLAELHTDFPERFEERRTLWAWQPDGERREVHLEAYWPHKGGMVLKFAGVDSMEEAERLLRSEIQVPIEARAELEPGTVYVSELVGCLVVDVSQAGREVGTVVDVSFGAGTAPLLIVKAGSGGGWATGTGQQTPLPAADAKETDALQQGTRQATPLRPRAQEFMIPFVESFTKKLDLKGKRIEMQLPDGMLELDAPLSAGKKARQGTAKD